MITTPCLPRRLDGLDDSAVTRLPLAYLMEKVRTLFCSSPSL
jgi:hypothetical protein